MFYSTKSKFGEWTLSHGRGRNALSVFYREMIGEMYLLQSSRPPSSIHSDAFITGHKNSSQPNFHPLQILYQQDKSTTTSKQRIRKMVSREKSSPFQAHLEFRDYC